MGHCIGGMGKIGRKCNNKNLNSLKIIDRLTYNHGSKRDIRNSKPKVVTGDKNENDTIYERHTALL